MPNKVTRASSTIEISHVAIKQDAEGRYCLNDFYKASGGNPKHKPSEWLRLKQAQELIEFINSEVGIPASLTVKGNRSDKIAQGTYVVKELVYAYAMWISPKFHLQVIRAYDALQSSGKTGQLANTLDLSLTMPVGKKRYLLTSIDGKMQMEPIPDDAYVLTADKIEQNITDLFPGKRLVNQQEYILLTMFREMVIANSKGKLP